VSVTLAVVFAAIACAPYLSARIGNALLVLAIVVSVLIWVFGQNLGELFTNGATDPNSGPLLVLLALAYWRPAGSRATTAPGVAVEESL
jgi:hypothetical protein